MTDTPGSRPGPADADEDLRATSDAIQADLRQLAAIEGEKETLDPREPRMDRLSEEAVRLADRIAREARAERALADEIV
jgi:hypothetical protein